jgi:hypothetical protein
MKIHKTQLSSSNNPESAPGAVGGFNRIEQGDINVRMDEIQSIKKKEGRWYQEYSAEEQPSDACFRRYPGRVEESGNIKYLIVDDGLDHYFDIFVWLREKKVIRFDLHYDVQQNEGFISWDAARDGFVHASVSPEKELHGGIKRTQTINGPADADFEMIKKKYRMIMTSTKNRKVSRDAGLVRILNCIHKTLKKL